MKKDGKFTDRCPICGQTLELTEGLSRANVKQWARTCRRDGRQTYWYGTAAQAASADFITSQEKAASIAAAKAAFEEEKAKKKGRVSK